MTTCHFLVVKGTVQVTEQDGTAGWAAGSNARKDTGRAGCSLSQGYTAMRTTPYTHPAYIASMTCSPPVRAVRAHAVVLQVPVPCSWLQPA
jgi:hypothetical protein